MRSEMVANRLFAGSSFLPFFKTVPVFAIAKPPVLESPLARPTGLGMEHFSSQTRSLSRDVFLRRIKHLRQTTARRWRENLRRRGNYPCSGEWFFGWPAVDSSTGANGRTTRRADRAGIATKKQRATPAWGGPQSNAVREALLGVDRAHVVHGNQSLCRCQLFAFLQRLLRHC